MKKIGKACLIIILTMLGLCIASILVMFATDICPPPGPWPQPPWCVNEIALAPSQVVTQVPTLTPVPKTLDVTFTVTIPYWSEGDIYVGVGENPKFLKLSAINEVIYQGTTNLTEGTAYYYTRGSDQNSEVSEIRRITDEQITDAVIDWQDNPRTLSRPDFQKSFFIGACHSCGVSFTKGNFIEPIGRSMDEIKEDGGNWISFMVYWFVVPDYRGNEIKPIFSESFKGATGWVHSTIKDNDLITLVEMAHERNLKVFLILALAPEDWGPGIKGKGDLEPSDPDLFFGNYENFIVHYADIAEQTNIDMVSIGSENDTLTQEDLPQNSHIDKTARWRDVIKITRQHYSGLLTYSVSCITEERCGPQLIKFWDDLDVIGWEWYVPIASSEHEPIEMMKANAERIITNNIQPLYDRFKKPIVLTEIGWEAYPGACAHTYGVGAAQGGDRQEQASCYEAVFQAIEDVDYIQGMNVFTWTANLPEDNFPWIWTDAANEVRFSIAENMIEKWYKYFEAP